MRARALSLAAVAAIVAAVPLVAQLPGPFAHLVEKRGLAVRIATSPGCPTRAACGRPTRT